ncbi:tRNA 2-thiouridine(34) synthase MnmA [Sulfurovum sp. bin170]|uniref:tRNA 2-thiouridine(34) synthase MnmA n=1 Tax=Sulfurovum sp. bin170 TaxID=2695268 RepID=UPI0013DFA85D|nr:tRNA 2-thiouridine(34) synthase MnmA [Sulfurovum sp. bin170]NEW59862.1 tRNA 2-thiouridine(34) synthase MnmA [Sulfurovum sp. bin170]
MSKKVLVGMSGGVDSTVSAILLQKEGYEVVGVYMKLHDNEAYHEENFSKAKRVGEYLGIKVHFHDLSSEFKNEVYDYFVDTYREGLTPNPCVLCNRTIKFGKMVEFADSLGIEKVATGHYLNCDGEFFYMAKDESKDQSYFVAQVRKEILPRLIFPLGKWLKEDVKEFAKNIPLLQDIGEQKESSEICFVENDYTEILERHMNIDQVGETVNSDGKVVGTHKGYMHYTIGKRRGFTVDGAHDPHFVLSINPKSNQIVVGKRDELAKDSFAIKKMNFFEDLGDEFESMVKVRYRTEAIPCRVKLNGDGGFVTLGEPVYGLAYEQVAVFYDDNRVIGSGIIC